MWRYFVAVLVLVVAVEATEPLYAVSYLGQTVGKSRSNAKLSAEILADFLGRATGEEVVVQPWDEVRGQTVFLVTDVSRCGAEIGEALRGKKQDAFVIRYPYTHEGKRVCLLASHDDFGVDYPVYGFLRQFVGVEWVGPGALGEIVPKVPDWVMPERIEVLEDPDFAMRLWADRTFNDARPLMAGSNRMGFHHAFGQIFHPKKYAESDPDVYPLIGGRRRVPDVAGEHPTSGWQPCVGSQKVQDIAVAHVIETYRARPQTASVSLSVNDGGANDCMCDECRALDIEGAFADPLNAKLSDRYFRFYNLVIERVVKEVPHARVAVLAYGPTKVAPVETKVHPQIVVFITVSADPTQFAATGAACSVYQYHLDSAYLTVRHYPGLLGEFLRTTRDAGGIGYYAQIHHNWASGGAKTYLVANLLWDADTDVEATLDRYYRLLVGERAMAAVRMYFDQWERVFERERVPGSFQTIAGWNSAQLPKLQHLRWEDLQVMDTALQIAADAEKTEAEAARLAMVQTHYAWIRANAAQYLSAKQLYEPRWVLARSPELLLGEMAKGLEYSVMFDQMWEEKIGADRTGWLLEWKAVQYVEKGRRFGDPLMVEPIRQAVEAYLADGIGQALRTVAEAADAPDGLVAVWKKAQTRYPVLAPYLQAEIDRLEGRVRPNLIANGEFEAGTLVPGEPPKLPNWWFYDRVGMVMASVSAYAWEETEGSHGKAIGLGPGKYPGLRTLLRLEPGTYTFSFRYKTVNRTDPVGVNLMQLVDEVDIGQATDVESVRALSKVNTNFIKFLLNTYPPTGGAWQTIRTTFQVDESSSYCLLMEPFYMPDDAWTWFDDVSIRKVW